MSYNNYNRTNPWDGISRDINDAVSVDEALRLGKLDWRVEQHDVARMIPREDGTVMFTQIDGFKENFRSDTGKSLGIVRSRYQVCQNSEGFELVDSLLDNNGIRLEAAGEINGGRRIWMCGRLPEEKKILGDPFETYIVFANSHDGTSAIQCMITPIRVWCRNTLNLALRNNKRMWSTRHTGNLQWKIKEAEQVLMKTGHYMDELSTYADRMANTPLKEEDLQTMLKYLFPYKDTDSDRKKQNMEEMKSNYMACYFMPDLTQFRGTQWGAINAMADFVDHTTPKRKTQNYQENRWNKIMQGHDLVDNMMTLMAVK